MLFNLLIWAQEADKGGGGPPGPPPGASTQFLILVLGIGFLFILLVIRPQKRREAQEREAMLNSLEKNDVLLTIGGIYVTVVSVNKEADEILVKIEDNARMKITRSAIASNITKEKERQKAREAAQQQQPATTEARK